MNTYSDKKKEFGMLLLGLLLGIAGNVIASFYFEIAKSIISLWAGLVIWVGVMIICLIMIYNKFFHDKLI